MKTIAIFAVLIVLIGLLGTADARTLKVADEVFITTIFPMVITTYIGTITDIDDTMVSMDSVYSINIIGDMTNLDKCEITSDGKRNVSFAKSSIASIDWKDELSDEFYATWDEMPDEYRNKLPANAKDITLEDIAFIYNEAFKEIKEKIK